MRLLGYYSNSNERINRNFIFTFGPSRTVLQKEGTPTDQSDPRIQARSAGMLCKETTMKVPACEKCLNTHLLEIGLYLYFKSSRK